MPLIADERRRPVVAVGLAGAVLTAVLAAIAWHGGSTDFDRWVTTRLYEHIGPHPASVLLTIADPVISYVVMGAVVVAGLIARRWDVAALAVAGPLLSLAVTELILKPLVGRHLGTSLAFPSGHETGVASSALVLVIGLAQLPRVPLAARIGGWVVLATWVSAAGVGLVRASYHWVTDVLGALGVVATIVLGTALALDRLVSSRLRETRSSVPAADSPRSAA